VSCDLLDAIGSGQLGGSAGGEGLACLSCDGRVQPLSRRTGHDGRVPEVDDDQLAALRRLRVAFGFVEVVEVISHDPATAPDESRQEARLADPGRMTSEERKQAHALLTRALSDPNWETASQALDDLMRKLLVVHRLLEAEERLAKRKPSTEPT
jgi:hypothetical protein